MHRSARVGSVIVLGLFAFACDLDFGLEPESPPERPPELLLDAGPRDAGPVTIETATARAISGGHMLVEGTQVLVADPDRDQLYALDVHDAPWRITQRGALSLPVGSEAQRMSFDDAGVLYVALRGLGQVARVDVDRLSILGTHEVCAAPRGLAWDAAREQTWLACAGGELLALDREGEVAQRVFIEPDLRDVVVDELGALYVSVFRQAAVLRLGDDLSVLERLQPAPHSRAVDFPLGDEAPVSERVFVPNTAWRMRPRPGGGVDVLHQVSRVQHDELDELFGARGASYGADPTSRCSHGIVATTLTSFSAEGAPSSLGPIGNLALGVDFVRTSAAFVFAAGGAGDFPGITAVPIAGVGPDCAFAEGRLESGGAVTAVERVGDVSIGFTRDSGMLTLVGADGATLTRHWIEGTTSVRNTGHRLFHVAPQSGVACASCHAEGRDDGMTWDLGAGPVRTHSLLGGIIATMPFHWRGDILDMSHVMEDTFEGRMGGERLTRSEVAALETWVDGLPAIAATVDAEAAARGREVFARAACASCHAGELGTQRASVIMAEAGHLQVPILAGVGVRAPFLHDGCARTLDEALLGCGGRTAHPGVEGLDEAERGDLVAFLAAWD